MGQSELDKQIPIKKAGGGNWGVCAETKEKGPEFITTDGSSGGGLLMDLWGDSAKDYHRRRLVPRGGWEEAKSIPSHITERRGSEYWGKKSRGVGFASYIDHEVMGTNRGHGCKSRRRETKEKKRGNFLGVRLFPRPGMD